ncbi:PmoA family protein, partial [Candidatus Sumerlaeota bacterium]|nr:PmoA family protein [Candidatus Sumerlaeota bacterium]
MRKRISSPLALICVPGLFLLLPADSSLSAERAAAKESARVQFNRDDAQGQLQVVVDGKEALVYRHGDDVDLPHYYPVRSPSGKSLTVQKTEPYPHHRSVWFADTVELAGHRRASFYMALSTQVDKKDPKSPFRDRVRQVEFLPTKSEGNQATIDTKLLWEMDLNVPVLDELRKMRVVALGQGEYFVDLTFTVTA